MKQDWLLSYRVFLALPEIPDMARLDLSQEYEWITRTFHTEAIVGEVTSSALWAKTAGRFFTIGHFGTHGEHDGIWLNGEGGQSRAKMGPDDLARFCRTRRMKLVYINTCESAKLAQYMIDNGVPAVIASNYKPFDLQAWSTAIDYYVALHDNGGDFHAAYELVKPRDGTLSFFTSGTFMSASVLQPVTIRLDKLEQSMENQEVRTAEFGESLNKITKIIEGSSDAFSTMNNKLEAIRGDYSHLEQRVDNLHSIEPNWRIRERDANPVTSVLIILVILVSLVAIAVPLVLLVQGWITG